MSKIFSFLRNAIDLFIPISIDKLLAKQKMLLQFKFGSVMTGNGGAGMVMREN